MAKSLGDIFDSFFGGKKSRDAEFKKLYGKKNQTSGKIHKTSRSTSHDPQLLAEYKTLAMRADKRLQRLEKYAKRPGMGELLKGAYARAMRDIKTWGGNKRFLTKPPSSDEDLKAKINDMRTFLRADTSTLKPGIDTKGFSVSSYERAAETFNTRYGTDLTWQEIGAYYGSKRAQKIANQIKASKTIAMALGEFKRMRAKDPKISGKKLRDDIKNNPNIKLSDDAAVNDVMKRMIRAGISPRTIFKQ